MDMNSTAAFSCSSNANWSISSSSNGCGVNSNKMLVNQRSRTRRKRRLGEQTVSSQKQYTYSNNRHSTNENNCNSTIRKYGILVTWCFALLHLHHLEHSYAGIQGTTNNNQVWGMAYGFMKLETTNMNRRFCPANKNSRRKDADNPWIMRRSTRTWMSKNNNNNYRNNNNNNNGVVLVKERQQTAIFSSFDDRNKNVVRNKINSNTEERRKKPTLKERRKKHFLKKQVHLKQLLNEQLQYHIQEQQQQQKQQGGGMEEKTQPRNEQGQEQHPSQLLPPWLSRYYHDTATYYDNARAFRSTKSSDDDGFSTLSSHDDDDSDNNYDGELEKEILSKELENFGYMLYEKGGFSWLDIDDILQAMIWKSSGQQQIVKGMIDFCTLLISSLYIATDDHQPEMIDQKPNFEAQQALLSKPLFIASIIHFADCINARQQGVYDWRNSERQQLRLGGSNYNNAPERPVTTSTSKVVDVTDNDDDDPPFTEEDSSNNCVTPLFPQLCPSNTLKEWNLQQFNEKNKQYKENVRRIAEGAAKIKRAEVLAHTILGLNRHSSLSQDEANTLRGLLLSTMDDFRSLAIRCVACLFRMEGILEQKEDKNNFYIVLGQKQRVVQLAKEALYVYATLAQRLGMHQLKARLEETAFKILYERQYKVISTLYEQSSPALFSIRTYLSSQINQILQDDYVVVSQLDYFEVTSRVKEPYSSWKKLMKKRLKTKKSKTEEDSEQLQQLTLPPDPSTTTETVKASNTKRKVMKTKTKIPSGSSLPLNTATANSLSLLEVQDGVALRIIIKARKLSPDETEETTQTREKMLCYYVQHLLQRYWPALPFRSKDYIRKPKPNGYQSLQYTGYISSLGPGGNSSNEHQQKKIIPFEIQIRSEEMHRNAEFGVAAHWDYKLAPAKEPAPADAVVDATVAVVNSTSTTTTTASDSQVITTIPTLPLLPSCLQNNDDDYDEVHSEFCSSRSSHSKTCIDNSNSYKEAFAAVDGTQDTIIEPEVVTSAPSLSIDNTLDEKNKPTDKVVEKCDSIDNSLGGVIDANATATTINIAAIESAYLAAMNAKNEITNYNDSSSNKTAISTSYIEAIVSARQTLVEQQIFVFVTTEGKSGDRSSSSSTTSQEGGQLVTLPLGARIADAIQLFHDQQEQLKQQQQKQLQIDEEKEEDDDIKRDKVEEAAASEKKAEPATPKVLSSTTVECAKVLLNGDQANLDDILENGDVVLLQM